MLRDLPAPVAADGQVVVEVKASAINFLEVLVRRGLLPADARAAVGARHRSRGHDGETAAGCSGSSRRNGGGYAEKAAVDEQWLFDLPGGRIVRGGRRLPDGVPHCAGSRSRGRCRSIRARVFSSTLPQVGSGARPSSSPRDSAPRSSPPPGSEEKLGLPALARREAGGDLRPARRDRARSTSSSTPSAGSCSPTRSASLRPLGVAIAIGFAGGPWPQLDPALLVGRNIGVQGFYLGRLMKRRARRRPRGRARPPRALAGGPVHPIVGATYPLAEVAEAHRLVESRRSTGKVVLVT